MYEFLFKIVGTFILSAIIYYGIDFFTVYWIEYWVALLISFVIVFGGFLLFDVD